MDYLFLDMGHFKKIKIKNKKQPPPKKPRQTKNNLLSLLQAFFALLSAHVSLGFNAFKDMNPFSLVIKFNSLTWIPFYAYLSTASTHTSILAPFFP